MRKYIRFILLFCTCYLLCSIQPVHVSADDKTVITEITHDNYLNLTNLPPIRIIQNDTDDDTALVETLMHIMSVQATAKHPDGSSESIQLRVNWKHFNQYNDYLDFKTIGTYYEVGTILLPDESYCFGENVPTTLSFPVEIYIPETPVTIVQYESNGFSDETHALEIGSSLDELLNLTGHTIYCYDADGTQYLSNIVWDTSQADMQTRGIYKLIGTPRLPMHTVAASDLEVPVITITISVQIPRQPDINCITLGRGNIHFPWVTPPGNLEDVTVWMRKIGEEWKQLTDLDGANVMPNHLKLRTYLFEPGCTYQIQVDYTGGQTGILTFTYDDEFMIEKYSYGDRDGGDTDGTPPVDDPVPPADDDITPPADDIIPPVDDDTTPPVDDESPSTDEPKPSKPVTDSSKPSSIPDNSIFVEDDNVTSVGVEKEDDGSYSVTIVENGIVTETYKTEDPEELPSDTISLTDGLKTEDIAEQPTFPLPLIVGGSFVILLLILLFIIKQRHK